MMTVSSGKMPAPPTNLTANGVRRHVNLTWTQSVSANIVQNKVYRSTTNGGPYSLIATLAATTSYQDRAVVSGKTYYYVVTAVNSSAVQSGYSNQAATTTK